MNQEKSRETRRTSRAGPMEREDMTVLGYHKIERMDDLEAKTPRCRIFTGIPLGGAAQRKECLVYLMSDCRAEDLSAIGELSLHSHGDWGQPIYIAPESGLDHAAVRKILGSNMGGFVKYEDLIWSRLKVSLNEYLQGFVDFPGHFIEPEAAEDGESIRLLSRIRKFFAERDDPKRIIAVTAHAAVGKTTLARKIAGEMVRRSKDRVVRRGVIPVLLESGMWSEAIELSRISEEVSDAVLQILSRSGGFRGAEWLLNPDVFSRLIRQGYIALIFDGFDELCAHPEIDFTARDGWDWLAQMAKDGESRMMITSRTAFWDQEVKDHAGGDDSIWSGITIYPFGEEQARTYFEKYFQPASHLQRSQVVGKVTTAFKAFKRIVDQEADGTANAPSNSFIRLPLCVNLIADAVNTLPPGESLLLSQRSGGDLVEPILLELLAREQQRQNLAVGPLAQLDIFRYAAFAAADGISRDDFAVYFDDKGEKLGTLQEKERFYTKLMSHPFLQKSDKDGDLEFKHDFLRHHFRASYLSEWVRAAGEKSHIDFYGRFFEAPDAGNDDFYERCRKKFAAKFVRREANGKGVVLERMVALLVPDAKSIARLGQIYCDGRHTLEDAAKSFLFHAICELVKANKSLERKEAARRIFSLLGAHRGVLSSLYIVGKVSGLDFSEMTVVDSCFEDSEFDSHCKAPKKIEKSIFRGRLEGSRFFLNGAQIGMECRAEGEALAEFDQYGHVDPNQKAERLRYLLRFGLQRFYIFQNRQFKQLKESSVRHAPFTQINNLCRVEILEQMRKMGIVEKKKTSQGQCYEITPDAKPDVASFVEDGVTRGKVKAALEWLVAGGRSAS